VREKADRRRLSAGKIVGNDDSGAKLTDLNEFEVHERERRRIRY
jgi:hypothetical protein